MIIVTKIKKNSFFLLTLIISNGIRLIKQRENTLKTKNVKEENMKTQSRMMDVVKSSYLVLVIAALGVFAFISAVLIAWPALAYISSKLFG